MPSSHMNESVNIQINNNIPGNPITTWVMDNDKLTYNHSDKNIARAILSSVTTTHVLLLNIKMVNYL